MLQSELAYTACTYMRSCTWGSKRVLMRPRAKDSQSSAALMAVSKRGMLWEEAAACSSSS